MEILWTCNIDGGCWRGWLVYFFAFFNREKSVSNGRISVSSTNKFPEQQKNLWELQRECYKNLHSLSIFLGIMLKIKEMYFKDCRWRYFFWKTFMSFGEGWSVLINLVLSHRYFSSQENFSNSMNQLQKSSLY